MPETDPDMPDPGNAEPEQFTREMTDDERSVAFAEINEVAVNLPEPEVVQ